VFVEVLALPADVDPASLRYAETPGWDSLAHMELVAQIEERFDVLFDTDDILGMRDLAAAAEILGRLGADLS
jgi:acyl carrier protein